MTTNEEKIKAFLNDEEKVKALASDEEFIGKVSGGTATIETYQKEFRRFDIELSSQDAEKTKDVVEKMLKKSPEKIDEKFLKSVVGGGSVAYNISGSVAGATFISGLGCSIASCVYASKANKASVAGDSTVCGKYIKKSQNCGIAAAALIGTAGVAGLIAYHNHPNVEAIKKANAEFLSEIEGIVQQYKQSQPRYPGMYKQGESSNIVFHAADDTPGL